MGKGVRGGAAALERCLAARPKIVGTTPAGAAPHFAHSLRTAPPRPVGLAGEAVLEMRVSITILKYIDQFAHLLGRFLLLFNAKFGR
jgi:hypothetical protein